MSLKYYANVLAFWVFYRIAVVFDVAWLGGKDGMVAAHITVLARKPMGTALAKDDVARYNVLLASLFGT